MTHYTKSKVDTGLLAEITATHGGSADDMAEIREAPTARRAYEIWEASGLLRACGDDVCARAADTLHRFSAEVGRPLQAKAAMVNFTGQQVVAATDPDWVGQ
jgi:cobalt-precorrin-5B (C1)-methyltransferase